MLEVLEFKLDNVAYGLPASRVVEVAPRVWITPLPGMGAPVLGVVCVRGAVAVVIDLRARLGHPPRTPLVGDHFIVAQGARRMVALVVDRVVGLSRLPLAKIQHPPVATPQLFGLVAQPDGLILIEDLDAALSLDEEQALDRVMGGLEGGGP
jgi:purine-binding chemotaxis protein CheW